ncbi:6-bladed beta-propeller [Gracilimonas mengyeensis]|uniref:6-bladed beta-propeller protein n=1 Tax=Gracilimonas mengyeensis TaxID=1302730 RepID=A0A521B5K9_9BACT|nr:6-bladed beta-propeller [Gracilimonas mengyeensis]SMO42345.1 6-bladed beta-propeller protein [Gracilimonas mengyeensis]
MGYRVLGCVLLVLTVSCTSSEEQENKQIAFSATYKKVLEISGQEGPEASWMLRPGNISLDKEGRIYITDEQRNFIQKFDSSGTFIQKIGASGSGPGEFNNLFGVYADSVLIGFSRGTSRMLRFSLDGDFQQSYPIQGVSSKPQMHRIGDQFLLFHVNYGDAPDEKYTLHIYNKSFELIDEQIHLSELYENFNPDHTNLALAFPNSVVFLDDSRLLMAPAIYSGKLFEYKLNPQSGEWEQASVVEGKSIAKGYSVLNNSKDADMVLFPKHSDDGLYFRIYGQSMYLSQLRDGRYVHFIRRDVDQIREYGIELYDEDLNFLGYKELLTDPNPNDEEKIILRQPQDMDSRNRFYSIDFGDDGAMVVAHELVIEN